jgi:uncharacterized protein (DUF433 family)
MSTQATQHVHLEESGVAWIDDTNVKVIEVVLDQVAYGWSPEEIYYQHPNLSLAQIHAALAHYHDHQAKFDRAIQRQLRTDRQSGGRQPRNSPASETQSGGQTAVTLRL